MGSKQFKPWGIPAVVASIVIIGTLTRYALLHFVCGLKIKQMNMQCSLIRELMVYEFEVGHKSTEATKNICWAKVESAILDHSTVTKWFKKLRWVHKNLDYQAKLGRPKTIDSEAMLKAKEVNLESTIRRVSVKLDISESSICIYQPLHTGRIWHKVNF